MSLLANGEEVLKIAKIINESGVILLQTDTVFGLVCLGTNEDAIEKIKKIKNRVKPSFGFFVKNLQIAEKYAVFNDIQRQIFNTIFPGHFTLILPATNYAKKTISNTALGTRKKNEQTITTIGLRIPKNNFCIKLLSNFDVPLLATSANISGQPTATNFTDIPREILQSVDAIYYDQKHSSKNIASTIVDITDINSTEIIRQGSGDINLIDKIIKKYN